MRILHWQIDPNLKGEAEENYRTRYAVGLKDKEPLEIIRRLTFDNAAPEITVGAIERLFDYVESNFIGKKISGVGLEVGAGPATMSSILARRKMVQKMYAVELCQPIVELLAPKVSSYLLDSYENKVTGVVGDFDHIELQDQSVDFIFDFFSLHHSADINVTLKECHRILKGGGFVFCFDKARPNHYTRADLDELLDAEYTAADKVQFGWPANRKLTRRLNGEKEYRLKDWQAAFAGAGFRKFKYYNLCKTESGNSKSRLIKNLISILPPSAQIPITALLPKARVDHKFILTDENRVFVEAANPFPKEISLLIAYR